MSTVTRSTKVAYHPPHAADRDEQEPPARRIAASPYAIRKEWLARSVAAVLLIPAIPVILVVMALVRITSRGPALFHQVRVGRGGKHFTIHKIRTMVQDAEAKTGPVWTQQGDPRVTRLGRVLRKLHLDEFPQLFNVVKGEMALIGPRPERPEFTHKLAREIPAYLDRLAVLPGITGLAQINLPPDSDFDGVRLKLALDLEYVERATLWMDIRTLLCTAIRLLGVRGLRPAHWLGVYRDPAALIAARRGAHAAGAGHAATNGNPRKAK